MTSLSRGPVMQMLTKVSRRGNFDVGPEFQNIGWQKGTRQIQIRCRVRKVQFLAHRGEVNTLQEQAANDFAS